MKRRTNQPPLTPKARRGRWPRQPAFTLVELMMVMIIIGIVAALALPRAARLSERSEIAALDADLRILQNGIELYAGEHRGIYPGDRPDGLGNAGKTEGAFASQLTMYTDRYGRASAEKNATYKYGPYLLGGIPPLPAGPKKGSTGVLIVLTPPAPEPTSDAGWVYNPLTGEIIGNVGAADFADYQPIRM